jgi:hypothetical protein
VFEIVFEEPSPQSTTKLYVPVDSSGSLICVGPDEPVDVLLVSHTETKGTGVAVGVLVAVGVTVGVVVGVIVGVSVGVDVGVNVGVTVRVGVMVGVLVG